MKVVFMTKEKMSYNEAPPSRILNTKKILEKYHEVYILSRKSNFKGNNIYEIPIKSTNFISNQFYKIFMAVYSLYFLIFKKIDFFITREYYFVVFLYPFTRLFNAKLIYDMHCFRYKELKIEGKSFKAFFMKPIELLSHKLVDYISTISYGLFDDLTEKIQKKTFLLPNGVTLDDFKNIKINSKVLRKYKIPKNKKIIGFIGNWMEWVDVPTLLDSSNYYNKDTVLVVVGQAYKNVNIADMKKKYPNVIFTGRIPHKDAIQILNKMDLCVLSYKNVEVIKHLSIRKTFEYLSAGKPILMSDSNIGERKYLKENENMVLYEPSNAKDLALKANKLLKNDKLLRTLSKNNLLISKHFSWEKRILDSDLLKIIPSYDGLGDVDPSKEKVSIIIKALNEEKHIAKCIESAIKAIEEFNGEVILVDSKSSDKTVEIAKKYPIKIIQLTNAKDRCCGVGPQVGFLNSKGKYVYILDGDMVIDKDFIKKALPYFKYNEIAGVGGNIFEELVSNLAFQVRSKDHIVKMVNEVNQLGMGGLYRRDALDKIGYFSNPGFYAYEEYDLGAELLNENYKLIRIPYKMINHFGDKMAPLLTLIDRMKSKYLFGSGQYLRRSIFRNHFFKTLFELKIYVFTLFWLCLGIFSLVSLFWPFLNIFKIYLYLTSFLIVLLLFIKKLSISKTIFSIFSWGFQAVGMFIGFFIGLKNPLKYKIKTKIIKNG